MATKTYNVIRALLNKLEDLFLEFFAQTELTLKNVQLKGGTTHVAKLDVKDGEIILNDHSSPVGYIVTNSGTAKTVAKTTDYVFTSVYSQVMPAGSFYVVSQYQISNTSAGMVNMTTGITATGGTNSAHRAHTFWGTGTSRDTVTLNFTSDTDWTLYMKVRNGTGANITVTPSVSFIRLA